jgi:ferredoxin-NADP reductase
VRTTGDWTAQLKKLQPKESVLIDGPFGLFSHLQVADQQEIIMIAGGIGITPMLSMLRYMADVNDGRKVTLLWSNQTPQRLVYPDEFQKLKEQLKGLRVVHLITRAPKYKGDTGPLDSTRLNSLLADCSRSSAVFICGPDKMMTAIHAGLVSLGFQRQMIFMERFRL